MSSNPSVSDRNFRSQFAFNRRHSHYLGDAKVNVFGYSDAYYASNVDDRRSITGYVFVFAGARLSWNSMTQHSVAVSTIDAEYYTVCKATQEAIYLRLLFEELGMKVCSMLVFKEDKQASSDLLSSQVECEELVLELVDASQQFSWYLHTALEPRQFHYYRDHLVIPRSSG